MRIAFVFAAAVGLAAAGAASAATRLIETTWAKPGVSFAEYRTDANLCAQGAMQIDISGTDPAKRMVKASRQMETLYSMTAVYAYGLGGGPNVNAIEHLRNSTRVQKTFDEIKDWQLRVLHGCLRGLGYRQVALSDEQRGKLKRLPLRSKRRQLYLHAIASNPEVLVRQAI